MAIAELTQQQTELLQELGLPHVISTDMSDDEWCDIQERLLEEVQLFGMTDSFDGENERGMLCSSIYNAMIEIEETE